MQATVKNIAPGWVMLFALLFFFFPQFLPIDGMMTAWLFTPVWVYFLYRWQIPSVKWVVVYLVVFSIFAIVHITRGAVINDYLISSLLLLCTVIFLCVFYHALESAGNYFDFILKNIVTLNFILTLCAIVLLCVPLLKEIVWYVMSISENIRPMPRLKMFTSEASHYSFLWALPFIYFCVRILFYKTSGYGLTLIMVTLPLLLSFSLGVISALAAAGMLMLISFRKQLVFTHKTKRYLLYGILIILFLILLLFLLYPDNPLFLRIQNVFLGKDTSARGRTYEAFILAQKITEQKSVWWGIGPGQLKLLGRQLIIQYYFYSDIPSVVRIPNACADTIICFGYIGLALRLLTEIFLFIKTKVAQHPFRLWLFLFLFLYQFTGSFITNVAEYMLWAITFSPFLFPVMEKAVPVERQ